ncbi:MAG: SDR family NAD(P)-dependent oxidoreductase [Nitrospirae bacterium]|nr:SDR family NAD(P)-dependent oxidoreductase [Nitrospirota bacterium]
MDKISLVTGGSSGLGFEIARCLCESGQNVCIVAKDEGKLNTAIDKLKEICKQSIILACRSNVSHEDDVNRLFQFISTNNFLPDMVFNVAGIGLFGNPEAATREMINKVFEANLIGTILVSTYALRAMQATGGIIVNIMSTAAQIGKAQESVYCAAKWGARGYTESLQAATKGTSVKVIAVYPGGMNTPFWNEGCGLSPDLSKFMSPIDVAKIIVDTVTKKDSIVVTGMIIQRSG